MRKRRRTFAQARDWALGREGLRELTGRGGISTAPAQSDREGEGGAALADSADPWEEPEADQLADEFAEIDAVLARSSRLLAGDPVPPKAAPQGDERLAVLYDLDWDEDARLLAQDGVLVRRPTMDEIEVVATPPANAPVGPYREIYDQLHVPLLLVWASRGVSAGRRPELETLAADPARSLVSIEGSHNVQLQRPEELAALVIDFLSEKMNR